MVFYHRLADYKHGKKSTKHLSQEQMKTLKWSGTLLCLFGILLTALNIFPANIVIGFLGSTLWAIAGYAQDDMALFTVEIVAVAFYFAGIVLFVTTQLSKWGLI